MHDIIIIGSGLGGLASGAILARRGMSVCVLEQHTQAGGCLQSFRRGGATFDTGFHCVGGLRPGEVLHPYFRHLRLLDLPWVQMDEACFEEIHIGDDVYAFAQGRERFIETLAERFPTERAGLEAFMDMLESTGHSLAHLFDDADTARAHTRERFGQSAYAFLQRTIADPRLRSVLSGASMKMELHADALPLYTFAQINNSYIQSAWRLRGGGEPIVRRLVEQIEAAGGTVRTRARVARLIAADGRLTAAELSDGERVEGRTFISDIHPALTVGLIPSDSGLLRRVYRQRIESLRNTFGFFTLHVHAPDTPIPYLNRNVSIYDGYESLWHNDRSEISPSYLISCRPPDTPDSRTVTTLDVLHPITPRINSLLPWDTKHYAQNPRYTAWKSVSAELCEQRLREHVALPPGFTIERVTTSTPRTYHRYTGTPYGSAYGIRRDCRDLPRTLLSPRTPIPNLLQTGQSVNVHGVLGITVTAFLTSAELLGRETVRRMLVGEEG